MQIEPCSTTRTRYSHGYTARLSELGLNVKLGMIPLLLTTGPTAQSTETVLHIQWVAAPDFARPLRSGRRCPRDNRSHAASEGRYRGSDLAVTAGELNAGTGVGRLGYRVRAWGDVMRVLLVVLVVAGTGVADDGPFSFDEGTSSVAVRTDAKGSTGDPLAASGDASAVAALKKLGARIKQDDQGNVVELGFFSSPPTRKWFILIA